MSTLYEDPNNLRGLGTTAGLGFFITSLVFLILATTAVGMRVWSKHVLRRNFLFHDYAMFLGLLFGIGYTVITFLSLKPGVVGMHIEDVMRLHPEALEITFKCFFASVFFWVVSTTFVKLSILHMYIGIFRTPAFVWSAYAVGAISTAFCVGYIVTGFVVCRPFKYHWDKTIPGGSCGATTTQEISVAAINMVLDFAIVVLPMPVLWQLQMPTKKKVMLMGILSLGLCICAINITRIILIVKSDALDFTYSLVPAGLFSGLEITIGILTGCLPTFGPLIWKRDGLKSTKGNAGYSGGSRSTGQSKNLSSVPRSHFQNDFERLDEDDVPLRDVRNRGDDTSMGKGDPRTNVRTQDIHSHAHVNHVGTRPGEMV